MRQTMASNQKLLFKQWFLVSTNIYHKLQIIWPLPFDYQQTQDFSMDPQYLSRALDFH